MKETWFRPTKLHEFIGQEDLKRNIQVILEASKKRGEPPDHVLFYSPPGLGKTTLAQIIARELGVEFVQTSGPSLERVGDAVGILTNLKESDVLFIDEIHRIPKPVEEVLYGAMEDFKVDVVVGSGVGATTVNISLPRFVLIGATTRLALLSAPLRERFGFTARLDFYSEEELEKIISKASERLGIKVEEKAARNMAKRSRGTPRIAITFLRRARDFSQVKSKKVVDDDVTTEMFSSLKVDELGLNELDRAYLDTIYKKFGGGPVGLNVLSGALSEDKDTIEDVIEPYLVKLGFIQRTPRGRTITEHGIKHVAGRLF